MQEATKPRGTHPLLIVVPSLPGDEVIPAYEFYPAHRRCPACRGPLVTITPLIRKFLQGPLHGMGITCFCVQCNSRYRAVSWLRFGWVSWLGPIGRWVWWFTTSLELTLKPEEF